MTIVTYVLTMPISLIKISAYHVKLVVLHVLLRTSALNVMRNIFS